MICYSTNNYINDIIKNEKYNTNFRIIRRFIRVANKLGYNIKETKRNYNNSFYVTFEKENGSKYLAFTIRFSDHFLKPGNQVPAGVLIEFSNIRNAIRSLQAGVSLYERKTPSEIDELWTNRYIHD